VTRFCANCGTEVDDTAVFCPTCGQPIDQETETEMPPAPSWPQPEPRAAQPERPAPRDAEPDPAAMAPPPPERTEWSSEPDTAEVTRPVEPQPRPDDDATARPAPDPRPARSTPPPPAREPDRPAVDLPLTMPVTLSAWLIGGGAALGAIGALIALFDGLGTAIDVLALMGLLAVAASVFLSDRLPHVPQLRLITLSVALVAFGVALDRLGFGRAGAGDLLLFLGTAAAAIGAIILETGRDQPLGGPSA
jgi:endogenous inhibitor of DNA gyrase (YacG/DUF329 family)